MSLRAGLPVALLAAELLPLVGQMGERHPQVYFRHGGSVFVLAGNVYGSRGGDPVLSEADFQRVIEGFRLVP